VRFIIYYTYPARSRYVDFVVVAPRRTGGLLDRD
jgi:hypothetical protein